MQSSTRDFVRKEFLPLLFRSVVVLRNTQKNAFIIEFNHRTMQKTWRGYDAKNQKDKISFMMCSFFYWLTKKKNKKNISSSNNKRIVSTALTYLFNVFNFYAASKT